jgi:putative acetyltransferase
MISTVRTTSENPDFQKLVAMLDRDLAVRDGDDHAFYSQFNKIDSIKQALVAYEDGIPVGCGAIKLFDADSMEVKRMFTLPEKRGLGIASKILMELETWATQLGVSRLVLETGIQQPEAIALYGKSGYVRIENYGQYAGVENSLCFEKILK